MTNKITLNLQDDTAREQISILWTKIQTLNERTKRQTKEIQELKKIIKK
jgi:hypothetical protein